MVLSASSEPRVLFFGILGFRYTLRSTLFLGVCLGALFGCGAQDSLQRQHVRDLGHFEFREPSQAMTGIMVGAPHGYADPDSLDYARWISDRTGAGIVTAFGFNAKRLSVTQPVIVRSISYGRPQGDPVRRGGIYPEFKELLQRTAGGELKFYLGVRFSPEGSDVNRIEIASSGFTFEELEVLKALYSRTRDQALGEALTPKVAMAIDYLDKISWSAAGIKHHGVLMRAERGISLRLPRILSPAGMKEIYREILSRWVNDVVGIVRKNPSSLARIEVKLMKHGRLERIPSRNKQTGVVIAAPHGTFDEYTAETVKKISYGTGLPAVIAKGFTPTEGKGWRINVNRPTEKSYPAGEFEIDTERASKVYNHFKQAVLAAAQGDLALYIEVHQNGRERNIEVATVGLSKEQALIIKDKYRQIRDHALRRNPSIETVELRIEPLDSIAIGAWAAKARGILSLPERSLHFELPARRILWPSTAREIYTQILIALVEESAALLAKGQ